MTLIELMVTLAIGALLIFAVVPDIGSWIRNTQVRNTAESIQTGIQLARNEAVRRNRAVQFSLVALADPAKMDNSCALSSSSGSWVVSLATPAGKCGAAPSNTVDPFIVGSHPVADGGRNTAVSALQEDGVTPADTITFDAFGRQAAGAIARIDVTGAAASADLRPLRVLLTSGGSIRMCDPKVSNTGDPRHC